MAFWREPTAEERSVLALAEISAGLMDFEAAYADRLREFVLNSSTQIGKWIAAGSLDPGNLTDADTLASFPGRADLQADLLRMLHGMAEFGKAEVVKELSRQKPKET